LTDVSDTAKAVIKSWPLRDDSLPPPPAVPYPDVHWDWPAVNSLPEIDPTAFVADGAIVVGRVRLKARCSIWYGCILRGDQQWIEVGEETNVQDGSILHIESDRPCILGNRVTLGHRAIVHGSTVGDGALIGIAATVLSHCMIGEGALIAAGAVVLERTVVPPHTLWAGCPAKQIKELTADQRERLAATYRHYVNNSCAYRAAAEKR
jgi:carbonic anhydrase/acetyltransferase-like protein (isoleucine patch superfamily)